MLELFCGEMLNKINFINGKHDVGFEFYNSSNGNDIGEIVCKNIFIFNFHTAFMPNEESFPCLVLDVRMNKLDNENIESMFTKLNYGYKYANAPAIPESKEYYFFKIEGGPIDISVLCQEIEIKEC